MLACSMYSVNIQNEQFCKRPAKMQIERGNSQLMASMNIVSNN